jgi:hypothetical protein
MLNLVSENFKEDVEHCILMNKLPGFTGDLSTYNDIKPQGVYTRIGSSWPRRDCVEKCLDMECMFDPYPLCRWELRPVCRAICGEL